MKKIFIKACSFLIAGLFLSACEKYEIEDYSAPVTEGARVKFYHASQDAPMLNFFLNDVQVTAGATPTTAGLLRGLAYNTTGLNTVYPSQGYAVTTPGDYNLRLVVPEGSGTTTPVPGSEITNAAKSVKLDNMSYYSVFAINRLASLEALVLRDDIPAESAGQTHIRFVNTMVGAPASFDVELVRTDVTPNVTTRIASDIAFKGSTNFTALPAGTYSIRVFPKGSTIAYTTGTSTLAQGRVYTYQARGNYVATVTTSTPVFSLTTNR